MTQFISWTQCVTLCVRRQAHHVSRSSSHAKCYWESQNGRDRATSSNLLTPLKVAPITNENKQKMFFVTSMEYWCSECRSWWRVMIIGLQTRGDSYVLSNPWIYVDFFCLWPHINLCCLFLLLLLFYSCFQLQTSSSPTSTSLAYWLNVLGLLESDEWYNPWYPGIIYPVTLNHLFKSNWFTNKT